MSEIVHIHSIAQLYQMLGFEKPRHPLITVLDYSSIRFDSNYVNVRLVTDFYQVSLKSPAPPTLRYGRQHYDFDVGTLLFIAPGQVFAVGDLDEEVNFQGWGLFFHPDLILPTTLGRKIKNYGFFSYEVHEALHVSEDEKEQLDALIKSIQTEYQARLDDQSHAVICTAIEQLLNYSQRFYSRQFITRQKQHLDLIAEFEKLVQEYFNSPALAEKGTPMVEYFADALHLSAGYLSDLLKKETGKTVKEYLHLELIERAKYQLLNTDDSVNEIAYRLGFEYPQYFTRLFKAKVGLTPVSYRNVN